MITVMCRECGGLFERSEKNYNKDFYYDNVCKVCEEYVDSLRDELFNWESEEE